MQKSLILLSGGLDSVVALGLCKEKYNIQLALTFDYGQKSAKQEIKSTKEICNYYKIEHKIIELNWLKEITHTALVSSKDIPVDNIGTKESANSVWVPNRNGLFLNIAACYADSYEYNYIIFGANKDEGQTFSDNTEIFRKRISDVFEYSTLAKPTVIAPLINYSKSDIVRVAIEYSVPLSLIRSCYNSEDIHCGICESCRNLKRALKDNNIEDYIKFKQ